MWRHYVYLHRKADSGAVFYVGKGSLRRSMKYYERAFGDHSRNLWWRNIVAKHGFAVEILAHFVDDAAAQSFERELIAKYGRADLKLGPLVNLTDGGDGHAGLVLSDKRRKEISEFFKALPRTPEWNAAIRRARKNGGNGGVVKRGDTLSPEWRASIARGKIGERNPMFGKTGDAHPTSRKVVNIETGETWPSVSAAATANGIKMQSLHNRLTGHRQNRTPLRLVA